MIWEEKEINIRLVNTFLNNIDIKLTEFSKNYLIKDLLVVKKPQSVDDNTILILNMIYERQLKRLY